MNTLGSSSPSPWLRNGDQEFGGTAVGDDGVTADWLAAGQWEVEVACRRYPCRVQLQPWYDPRNERIRS